MTDPADQEAPGRRVILVVEDTVVIAELIASALEDEPTYKAVAVDDGAKALEILQGIAVDLVLLDVQLPGLSGTAVYDRMQEHPDLRRIPVVFMSADAGALTELRKRGLKRILRKPFAIDDLLGAVALALDGA